MTYSGAVKVGGPADVHELQNLMISKVAVGPMDNNAYLLRCRATDEQLLIDAANDAGTLLTLIGDDGIASVVTTHQHGDHWQALAEVVVATGARTYAGRDDAEGIPVPTDVLVGDGDTIRVGRVELTARHLVGHTPGSIALVYDDPHGHPRVHRGLSLPRRSWPDNTAGSLPKSDERARSQGVQPAGRDVDLPRTRQRHHPRR